jgi:hypothetical protein
MRGGGTPGATRAYTVRSGMRFLIRKRGVSASRTHGSNGGGAVVMLT